MIAPTRAIVKNTKTPQKYARLLPTCCTLLATDGWGVTGVTVGVVFSGFAVSTGASLATGTSDFGVSKAGFVGSAGTGSSLATGTSDFGVSTADGTSLFGDFSVSIRLDSVFGNAVSGVFDSIGLSQYTDIESIINRPKQTNLFIIRESVCITKMLFCKYGLKSKLF
jgi:hypothetical protein